MADAKLTALTEETAPTGDDITYVVDDPGGAPLSRKVTLDNLSKGINHGNLVGLADDDHPQYRLESEDHTHASAGAQGGQVSHADLTNLTTGDPHTQYRLESADHSHQTAGAEAGTLDHGLALTGLTDDDHTIYLKEKASGGLASEIPLHTHGTAEEGGATDAGLEDASGMPRIRDQVFAGSNITITELADGSGDAISIASTGSGVTDHGALTGLDPDDDHTQYLLASAATDRPTFATNWTDLTDGGATTLHSHSGQSAETDQALYDAASTAEKFSDHVFPGTNISITEVADGSGDAISIAGSTTPTITDFTNAAHTHADAANAGQVSHADLTNLTVGDPHTQYRLEADDHTHQSTGAQAGTLDHGLALTGLTDDDHTQYLLASGTRALSADWDAGSFEIRAQTLESDVATGTAPLTIASTTKVTNLNADLLDDQSGAFYLDSANFTGTDWDDLTDGGATVLHSHAGQTAETDQALYDAASTAESAFDRAVEQNSAISTVNIVIDGGGSAITTGVKLDITIPFNCTIIGSRLLADQSGSIVLDGWKDTLANYPPTVADTITASAKPTLSTATNSEDVTLVGWTTTFNAGDTLRVNVDSITTITRVTWALMLLKL